MPTPDREPSAGKIALELCYDGTRYCGWQVQPNAVSVQKTVQDALEKVLSFRPDVSGCSRTDAGVHANSYICHIDSTGVTVPVERLPNALNSLLHGTDVAVKAASLRDADFHARYSCREKEYLYKIWNAPYENPFLKGRAWHVPFTVEETKLTFVGREFEGTHDFSAFMSKGSKIKEDTVRTVKYFRVVREDALLTFSVCADGFLYNMVRIMIGTYIAAALGHLHQGDVRDILLSRDRSRAGDTAPACGLYLNKIVY